MKNRILEWGIALSVLTFAGCGSHESESEAPLSEGMSPVSVELAPVDEAQVATLIDVTGIVRAADRASLAPKVMGTIIELPVELGQRVEAGELLVKIEAAEIGARVLQAEAQLKQAERDLHREQGLLEKGASTEEMVNNLVDRVAVMQAMVAEARAMAGYTEIRAPFAGQVAQKMAMVGDLASPGTPLITLEGAISFEVEANVPESLASELEVGKRYDAALPTSRQSLELTLSELSASFDASTRTVLAKFSAPRNEQLRSGQFVRVQIPGQVAPRLIVPEGAVSKNGQLEQVYVAQDGRAVMRLVKTGSKRDGMVEILSGLDAGEQVIVSAEGLVREGQELEVAP